MYAVVLQGPNILQAWDVTFIQNTIFIKDCKKASDKIYEKRDKRCK